jgi:hypothetical protein
MRILTLLLCSFLLFGCTSIGGFKLPSFSNNTKNDSTGTVAGAKATSAAVDRMSEIDRRNEETRKTLELEYDRFRKELSAAYEARTQVDDENFDRISEINFGIFKATEEITDLDYRVLIANLKSQENMARLMPISESKKKEIIAEIETDRKKAEDGIINGYKDRIKAGEAAAAAYAKADALVKQKELEKIKLRDQQAELITKMLEAQEVERERLRKEAADAVLVAKEKQRLEMVGWIVKALLAVGMIILVIGFLLKSTTFIISGIAMLGLAYVAATIPFWVVAVIMGTFVIVMVIVDPKTGKIEMPWKKKAESITTPPTP